MCLKSSISSSVSSTSSSKSDSYYQLLEAFKETHEEENKLALTNNRLKGLKNWLETRVKSLEEELDNSINDFENLELFTKTLLVSITQVLVKIAKSLKIKFFIL